MIHLQKLINEVTSEASANIHNPTVAVLYNGFYTTFHSTHQDPKIEQI